MELLFPCPRAQNHRNNVHKAFQVVAIMCMQLLLLLLLDPHIWMGVLIPDVSLPQVAVYLVGAINQVEHQVLRFSSRQAKGRDSRGSAMELVIWETPYQPGRGPR